MSHEERAAVYFDDLADPDRQLATWRRIHAEQHQRGLRYGGSKRPWAKCAACQREQGNPRPVTPTTRAEEPE